VVVLLVHLHQGVVLPLEAAVAAVVLQNKAIHGLALLLSEVVMVEQEKQIIIDMDMMLLMVVVEVGALVLEDKLTEVLVDSVEEEKEEYRLLELCAMD
tara:strand:- start:1232 stop:1525 length:294 start_codon:yes stop_codon:yes gene_type:complete